MTLKTPTDLLYHNDKLMYILSSKKRCSSQSIENEKEYMKSNCVSIILYQTATDL